MFQHKDELYKLSWEDRPSSIKISDRKILLPEMPPEAEMVNYTLPSKKQKFVRRPIPSDMKYWDRQDIEYFVEAEWHRRKNGYWILIKGDPYYIPGTLDTFVNYWTCEWGGKPDWRFVSWQWFMFWWSVCLDPDCFGLLNVKPRRVGSTENAVFSVWERSTRYNNFHGGIIHIDEKGAKKNFDRIILGNKWMPFWFKPYNTGTSSNKGGHLLFDIPAEKITAKMIKEGRFHDDTSRGIGSEIYVEPAITGAFDGVRVGTYYSDEIFKVKSHKFDILKQWENIKKVLSINNSETIVGKAIKTSTVEEVEDGRTVEIAREIIEDSQKTGPDGRSVSGLALLFQDYTLSAKVDEWGFPKVKEAVKRHTDLEDYLRKEKRWDKLLSLRRKEPASIEDALSSPMGEAIFYPEMCEERLLQINQKINRLGQPQEPRGVYGSLHWKNNIWGGEVVWQPAPRGQEDKWFISQHPGGMANKKIMVKGKPYPANMGYFRMGCDPFEASEVEGRGSDGAFTVKKLFNLSLETGTTINVDENGTVLNPEDMLTNQVVCDYKFRNDSLYDFYDDVYKTCVYFGVAVFPETNKRGLVEWMQSEGLDYYIQVVPEAVQAFSSRKKDERGKAASSGTINQYISALKLYIYQYIWCCHHPRLIQDWKLFTKKTRTLRDLSVASGYTELAELDTRYIDIEKPEEVDPWEMPFQNYN